MRIDSFKARSCAGSNRKGPGGLYSQSPRIGNTLRRKSQRVVNKIAAYTVDTTVDGNARVIENLSTLIEPVQKDRVHKLVVLVLGLALGTTTQSNSGPIALRSTRQCPV